MLEAAGLRLDPSTTAGGRARGTAGRGTCTGRRESGEFLLSFWRAALGAGRRLLIPAEDQLLKH